MSDEMMIEAGHGVTINGANVNYVTMVVDDNGEPTQQCKIVFNNREILIVDESYTVVSVRLGRKLNLNSV